MQYQIVLNLTWLRDVSVKIMDKLDIKVDVTVDEACKLYNSGG